MTVLKTKTAGALTLSVLAAIVLGGLSASLSASADEKAAANTAKVTYPDGYRGWRHVKSMWIGPKHGLADPFLGLHHVYVNSEGTSALERGKDLPDGSVLVFDLLSAPLDGDAIAEGKRTFVGVMEKNRKRWPETGGWGFEVFKGDSTTARAVNDGGVSCFACHRARSANDHVFSTMRK